MCVFCLDRACPHVTSCIVVALEAAPSRQRDEESAPSPAEPCACFCIGMLTAVWWHSRATLPGVDLFL